MGDRKSIYRGWYVIFSLFVAGMMVYGAGLYGFTLLVPPLSEEFGWSRAATGGLVSVFWLAAPLTPLGGRAISRFGAARVVGAGIILESVCLAFVALTDSLTMMYILRALMGVGKIMMMAGVTAQASLWFGRRFGFAIAICFAGWHFGGLTVAPIVQYLIDVSGWRQACLILAGLITALALPPVWYFGRWKPGNEIEQEHGPRVHALNQEEQYIPGNALHTWAFWCIIGMTVLGSFTYGSLLSHEVALLEGVGIGSTIAAAAISTTAGTALVGALCIGYLSDRFGFKIVMALELLLMTLGAGGFLVVLGQPSVVLVLVSAAAFGLAVGGFDTCIVAHLQRRFGSENFNHLFGVWYFFYLAVLFAGPIGAGWLFDLYGNYVVALWAMLGGLAGAAVLLILGQAGPAKALSIRPAP